MNIRPMTIDDLPAAVELNNAAVPALSVADKTKMTALVANALLSLVAEHEGEVVGFCINFGPGADYSSINYRWFCERFDDFVYLDRIAVADHARNMGIGAALYASVQDQIIGCPWLFCEVNLRPRNDGSLRFHERIGFVEVGQQETDYGFLVSMLAKDLRGARRRRDQG